MNLPAIADAQEGDEDRQAEAAEEEADAEQSGQLAIEIRDEDTDEPIAGVEIIFLDVDRQGRSDGDGAASFDGLPLQELAVEFSHPDYLGDVLLVETSASGPVEVEQYLVAREAAAQPDANGAEGRDSDDDDSVVVTRGHRIGAQHIYRPTTSVEGDELQRKMSTSVPETLSGVPGFNAQYNGPGASSPSIRGMPGDRVLMLEDGHITGDLYSSAADHGVMVEPISAERIDVVRGPASLLYGSSSLGGVVNVIREDVPRFQPSQVEGTVSTQFHSVNTGLGAGAVLRGPVGPLAYYLEATGRRAGATQTPAGTMEQTGLRGVNAATGLSWVPDWGVIGAAFRFYDNAYDVPGEFNGELIPGGHAGGVTSEARRMSGRFLAEVHEPFAFFEGAEFCSSLVLFSHDEVEGVRNDETIIGASFDQMTTDSHLQLDHQPLGDPDGDGWSAEGTLGLSFQTRDLDAGGAAPGTRSGTEQAAGVYAFEEFKFSPFRLQTGLRYDFRHVSADDLSDLRVNTQDRNIVKEVSSRNFNDLSASLAALWEVAKGWTVGLNLARSFRNPSIEELYSDGPHLADFSFDIGSPDLDSEIGHGADLFARADLPHLELEVAGYYNRVDDYIYYRPTGETVRVFREGAEPRNTPVFEARDDDALFVGAEGRVQWEVIDDLFVDITASYTAASRRADGDPLPYIPPLSGRFELRYDGEPFFGSIGTDLGAAQNRVPRPISVGNELERPQEPTAGYALAHAMVGWRHFGQRTDHTVMLQAKNFTNRQWRDHMSRIKDIAPQPGRNIQLSYRMMF